MSATVSTKAQLTALGRFMRCFAMANGDPVAALGMAEGNRSRWSDTPTVYLAIKASVDAMSTGGTAGALSTVQVSSLILPLLRDAALVDRLALRRVPLNTSVASFSGETDNSAVVVEGSPKPTSRFSTATLQVLPKKVSAAIVVTRDLLQRAHSPSTDAALGLELIRAATSRMDRAFADPGSAGSIADGATSFASSGVTITALDADIKAALNLLAASGDDALTFACWVVSTKVAVLLATLRSTNDGFAYPLVGVKGGVLAGLPLYTTGSMTSTDSPSESSILLLDQSAVLYADAGQGEITVAQSASVEMDSAPTGGATALRSLWQSDLVALRCERFCGWSRRDASSVIAIADVQAG